MPLPQYHKQKQQPLKKNDINNTEKKVMQYERDAITLRVRGLIF